MGQPGQHHTLLQPRTCCLPYYAVKELQLARRAHSTTPGTLSYLVRVRDGDVYGSWFDCFATGRCAGISSSDTPVAQQLCLEQLKGLLSQEFNPPPPANARAGAAAAPAGAPRPASAASSAGAAAT